METENEIIYSKNKYDYIDLDQTENKYLMRHGSMLKKVEEEEKKIFHIPKSYKQLKLLICDIEILCCPFSCIFVILSGIFYFKKSSRNNYAPHFTNNL
jgi:hypothetical protein